MNDKDRQDARLPLHGGSIQRLEGLDTASDVHRVVTHLDLSQSSMEPAGARTGPLRIRRAGATAAGELELAGANEAECFADDTGAIQGYPLENVESSVSGPVDGDLGLGRHCSFRLLGLATARARGTFRRSGRLARRRRACRRRRRWRMLRPGRRRRTADVLEVLFHSRHGVVESRLVAIFNHLRLCVGRSVLLVQAQLRAGGFLVVVRERFEIVLFHHDLLLLLLSWEEERGTVLVVVDALTARGEYRLLVDEPDDMVPAGAILAGEDASAPLPVVLDRLDDGDLEHVAGQLLCDNLDSASGAYEFLEVVYDPKLSALATEPGGTNSKHAELHILDLLVTQTDIPIIHVNSRDVLEDFGLGRVGVATRDDGNRLSVIVINYARVEISIPSAASVYP